MQSIDVLRSVTPIQVTTMRELLKQPETANDEEESPLTISPEKVCFIIMKAKEFDAKDEVTEPNPGSNPADDRDIEVLENHKDESCRRGAYVIDQFALRGRADRSGSLGMAGSRRLFSHRLAGRARGSGPRPQSAPSRTSPWHAAAGRLSGRGSVDAWLFLRGI